MNQHLAHLARDPKGSIPTAPQIENAIKLIGETARRYALALNGIEVKIEPKVLFDWTASLRFPWIKLQE